VFCDTEDAYFTIDPAQLEAKITPRTRGVIVVHLYGQPADMDTIDGICRRHNLWLIEDCAQAHLATYKNIPIGHFGDAATFSFYPGKNLGAMGDAGCLVTNRDDIAEFATLFARHGGKGDHVMEGICSRMDGLQAAVLNVKMPYLSGWNSARRIAAQYYHDILADIHDLSLPVCRPECEHVYHLYVVRSPCRDKLHVHLSAAGIPCRIHYERALPFYKAYNYLGHTYQDFPVATQHAGEILSLPMHPYLKVEEQLRIVHVIREFSGTTT